MNRLRKFSFKSTWVTVFLGDIFHQWNSQDVVRQKSSWHPWTFAHKVWFFDWWGMETVSSCDVHVLVVLRNAPMGTAEAVLSDALSSTVKTMILQLSRGFVSLSLLNRRSRSQSCSTRLSLRWQSLLLSRLRSLRLRMSLGLLKQAVGYTFSNRNKFHRFLWFFYHEQQVASQCIHCHQVIQIAFNRFIKFWHYCLSCIYSFKSSFKLFLLCMDQTD